MQEGCCERAPSGKHFCHTLSDFRNRSTIFQDPVGRQHTLSVSQPRAVVYHCSLPREKSRFVRTFVEKPWAKVAVLMKLPPAWRRKLLTDFLANTATTSREGARACGRKEITVRYWLAKFRNGECTLEDARRSGRPKLLNSKAKKVIRDHLTRSTRATIASATASVQKVV